MLLLSIWILKFHQKPKNDVKNLLKNHNHDQNHFVLVFLEQICHHNERTPHLLRMLKSKTNHQVYKSLLKQPCLCFNSTSQSICIGKFNQRWAFNKYNHRKIKSLAWTRIEYHRASQKIIKKWVQYGYQEVVAKTHGIANTNLKY